MSALPSPCNWLSPKSCACRKLSSSSVGIGGRSESGRSNVRTSSDSDISLGAFDSVPDIDGAISLPAGDAGAADTVLGLCFGGSFSSFLGRRRWRFGVDKAGEAGDAGVEVLSVSGGGVVALLLCDILVDEDGVDSSACICGASAVEGGASLEDAMCS